MAREFSVRRARADLAAWATGRDGETVAIAVEVKVNDPISEMQLAAYVAADLSPVLYVPGLTGLMFAPNGPLIGERWVTGLDVADAVEGIELPPMIGSCVDAVRSEGRRIGSWPRRSRATRSTTSPRTGKRPTTTSWIAGGWRRWRWRYVAWGRVT